MDGFKPWNPIDESLKVTYFDIIVRHKYQGLSNALLSVDYIEVMHTEFSRPEYVYDSCHVANSIISKLIHETEQC